MPVPSDTRALVHDVFGTVVDWRSSVTNGLVLAAKTVLNDPTSSIASSARSKASSMDLGAWGEFAQQWRISYFEYTRSIAEDPSLPVKTIDEHHHDSLKELLTKWELDGLWDPKQVQAVSLIWHKLVPWPDSAPGLKALSSRFTTTTLSNGNLSLLEDLKAFGDLAFTHLFSAEQFGTYKPNKAVYLGAAEKLGFPPQQCCMVAAHLGDLKAAKGCGFSTIYVERPQEEAWSDEQVLQARKDGLVDLWVSKEESGLMTVNEKLARQHVK